MIKRTLYFGNPTYLSLKNAQLVVKLPEVEKNETLGEEFINGKFVSRTIPELKKELLTLTKEVGRYHINFKWKRGGSHVLTLERLEDGGIVVYDPQDGEITVLSKLLKDIVVRRGLDVLRVDNVLINMDIIEEIVQSL